MGETLDTQLENGKENGVGERPHSLSTATQPGLWALIREDCRTNGFSNPGFHVLLMYRFGRWAAIGKRYRRPIFILATLMQIFTRNVYGIEVYWESSIGRRLIIGRQGPIVMHKYCTIGDDCVIQNGATIGAADMWSPDQAPVLGDNVEIAPRGMILGKVTIGNHVRIGANAVVITDVPDNSIVSAPPSRVSPSDRLSGTKMDLNIGK